MLFNRYLEILTSLGEMTANQRYLMLISYLGSGLWGSQRQVVKGCNGTLETVQYLFENALKNIFQLTEERPIRIRLASRTDKGVHALRSALHVDLPQLNGEFLKPYQLKFFLNSHFKGFRNIQVLEVYAVPDSFRVSSHVLYKTYLYRCGLLHAELYKQRHQFTVPLLESERTHFLCSKCQFDLKKAQEATHLFEGKKDFGAIVGRPTKNVLPTICNISSFKVDQAQPLVPFDSAAERYNFYHFTCKGDRFLYHMVRRMVSLTLSVGFKQITLDHIQKLFDQPVPSSWPNSVTEMVPGNGLYLVNVEIDLEKINETKDEVSEVQCDKISLLAEC